MGNPFAVNEDGFQLFWTNLRKKNDKYDYFWAWVWVTTVAAHSWNFILICDVTDNLNLTKKIIHHKSQKQTYFGQCFWFLKSGHNRLNTNNYMLCESDIKFQRPEHGSSSTFRMSAFIFCCWVSLATDRQQNSLTFSIFKCTSEQFRSCPLHIFIQLF